MARQYDRDEDRFEQHWGDRDDYRRYRQSDAPREDYGRREYRAGDYERAGYGRGYPNRDDYDRTDYGYADRSREYGRDDSDPRRDYRDHYYSNREQGGGFRPRAYEYDDDRYRRGADYDRGYGERGYAERGYSDRDLWDRARDEVKSWFGDDEAERRRRRDEEPNRNRGGYGRGDEGRWYERRDRDYDRRRQYW